MLPLKKILAIFAVMIASASVPIKAQVVPADSVIDYITKSLDSANADSLTLFFNNRLELSLPDFSGISSRSQARLLLMQFFKTAKPSSFTVISRSYDKNGYFIIGTMICSTMDYRVSFLTKKQSGEQFIYQLLIE